MKNFHVPLPDDTYQGLRAAAEYSKVPATTLVREAIESWLRHQRRKVRHDAITAFALRAAATPLDLDNDLEAAAVEFLKGPDKKPK